MNTVSKEGAALFKQRMQQALRALASAPAAARKNPLWYELTFSYQLYGGSATQAEMDSTLAAGIAAFPRYWPLRTIGMTATEPRWGGSSETTDAYIAHQVASVAPADQAMLYARLYWAMQQRLEPPATVFDSSHASWPMMVSGFRELLKRYPLSFWNRQNFAAFACRVGDAAIYREIRPSIQDFIHPAAWVAPFTLDTCDYRLLTGS